MSKPVKHGNNWRVRWIDHEDVRCSAVFESFKEAQNEVRKRRAETAEIKEGLRAKPPADRTFAEMCDYWMANRAIHKRNIREDKSISDRHLGPAFGTLKLKDLGVALRNSAHQPPTWAQQWVRDQGRRKVADGAKLAAVALPNGGTGYPRAIGVAPVCLACHCPRAALPDALRA